MLFFCMHCALSSSFLLVLLFFSRSLTLRRTALVSRSPQTDARQFFSGVLLWSISPLVLNTI
jgi:hypothetical protein